jgi:SOS-response transcriptional repressor LexA
VRMRGETLRDEQVLDGDLIIAERREKVPADGDLVLVVGADRAAAVRSVRRERAGVRLIAPGQPDQAATEMIPGGSIEGVITGLLRHYA